MKALILAAGLGTRLGQLTETCPKPMLPIGGRPLLEHTIRWIRAFGVTDIAINVHHIPESIMDYFGDGRGMDVSIRYSQEDRLLGTAGAAKRLQSYLDEPFLVVYGDVLTNLDLNRLAGVHFRSAHNGGGSSIMTLALYAVRNPTECGLVAVDADGWICRFVEKPPADEVFTDLAFSGIMICDPAVLSYVPSETYFDIGHDLIPALLANKRSISAQPVKSSEYVIDIGTMSGYLKAQHVIESHAPLANI